MCLQGRDSALETDGHVALWLAGNPPARHWALVALQSLDPNGLKVDRGAYERSAGSLKCGTEGVVTIR